MVGCSWVLFFPFYLGLLSSEEIQSPALQVPPSLSSDQATLKGLYAGQLTPHACAGPCQSKPGWARAASLGYWPEDLFVLVDERHLHVLAGRGHQLPTLWSGGRSLLFVAAHAHEEEEASDDQGDGNAGHQDVQDPHLAAISRTWGPQWGGHQFSKDTTFSAKSSPTPSLPPLSIQI